MKTFTLAAFAVMMCLGVTLAAFGGSYGSSYGSYGGGSGYTYMPVSGGYGAAAGADNSFLYLIGMLFLILILFNSNLFNTTSTSTTTPITILQG